MRILTSMTRAWLTRSFRPFHFTACNDAKLFYADTEKLGLYIHIPFCRRLCTFCPYCKVVYDPLLAEQYVEALLKEIDMVGNMAGNQKKTVTSLYFGGGTPALLAGEMKRILNKIEEYFIITEGIGLELHPFDVTMEKLQLLREAGVSKISIGIQSFQADALRLLGRTQPDVVKLFAALQAVPFETVSMDFIFALPGQTFAQIQKDIDTAFANGANHIALYPFIDFSFTKHGVPNMKAAEKKQLLYKILAYCKEKGYVRDSIWTFSKYGNTNYSSMTRENFLGFGCSATTLLKDQFKINTFAPEAYIACIEKKQLPTALTLKFTKRQRMVYYLFWTAYSLRVDADAFEEFFGSPLEKNYGLELSIAVLLGLAEKKNGMYTMTDKGSYYYHYYENDYTLSYIDQMWSLLGKTAFPEELIIK